jgi:signal transduction histidine kinase
MAADNESAASPLASPQSSWRRVAGVASAKIRTGWQKVQSVRLRISGPQKFTIVSLLIIVGVMTVTSLSESTFYRQAIITRESEIIYDLVRAFTLEQETEGMFSSWDLQHYSESLAKTHFEHSFGSFKNLHGFARLKVFNPDKIIVWSDEPRLIGTNLSRNMADLTRAIGGEVRAVFNAELGADPLEALPQKPLLEFYVPFTLRTSGVSSNTVTGVLSIYRSSDEVNNTIQRGLYLLWSGTGLGGLILYITLYRLFYSVYFRHRKMESRFIKLSADQERLMHIEKLSAVGQMVSEVAHQLNNPLVGVINLAELAERELDNPQRVRELLGEVRKAGIQCRSFVQKMLRITTVADFEPQLTDMNRLAHETIMFFQQSLGGHPPVRFEAPDEAIFLKVDPLLIRKALFNLIHNAAQADPTGSVVVSLALDKEENVAGCRLTVSDSGPGLTPGVAAKLFTPFFTTRPGGTGLGLSIAHYIAVRHGGSIRAENKPGGGARFTIWLPG